MTTLLEQAKLERDRLDKVIAMLEPADLSAIRPVKRGRGWTAQPKRHGRKMSAAAKKAMSLKLKAIWAAKKAKKASRSKAARARVAK